MKYSAGDEVIVRGTDLVGTVVKQRLDDDMYLVRIEKFFNGDSLQGMKEAEADLRQSQPAPIWAPQFAAEWERLGELANEHFRHGATDKLSQPMIESMKKLGLIKKL